MARKTPGQATSGSHASGDLGLRPAHQLPGRVGDSRLLGCAELPAGPHRAVWTTRTYQKLCGLRGPNGPQVGSSGWVLLCQLVVLLLVSLLRSCGGGEYVSIFQSRK